MSGVKYLVTEFSFRFTLFKKATLRRIFAYSIIATLTEYVNNYLHKIKEKTIVKFRFRFSIRNSLLYRYPVTGDILYIYIYTNMYINSEYRI